MSRRYDVLLFDLDGTVIDSAPQIRQCVNLALAAKGLPELTETQARAFMGPPLMDSFQGLMGFTYEEAAEATATYRLHYNAGIVLESKPFCGVELMLRELKESGLRIALATSKPEPMALRILSHNGLDQYFECITGAGIQDHVRHSKADVVEECLKRMGIAHDDYGRVIMIGDRKYDVLGSGQVGLSCIGVSYGYADPGELEKAGAVVVLDSLDQLKAYLLEDIE